MENKVKDVGLQSCINFEKRRNHPQDDNIPNLVEDYIERYLKQDSNRCIIN